MSNSCGRPSRNTTVVTPIPGRDSLRLDTSQLSPSETADRIIEHYRLPQAGPTS